MKRTIAFLCIGLFALLILQPGLVRQEEPEVRVPVLSSESGSTNETADQNTSESHALIAIDPSHGGQDLGYTSASTIPEKEINMQLALAIGAKLQEAGYNVIYTRMSDDVASYESEDVANQARLQSVRENQADYLISLRLNNNADPLSKGFSLFTQPVQTNMDLANAIAANLESINFSTYEGLDTDHYANFSILSDSSIPSVLVELGYITNTEDYSKLMDVSYQNQIGEAVTKAFLEVVD